jgi:pimeloyl-ACP methyl ester carboxylesterase
LSDSSSASAVTTKRPSPSQVFHFLTHPRRVTPSPENQTALAGATRLDVIHRGLRLAVWAWGKGPPVLLLHGWESHAGYMAGFVAPLIQAGFSVYALDAPGHGESDGSATDAVDFGRAVLSAVESLGMPHAIIGHSVGSAAALFAFSRGANVRASVHLAGPSSMERVLRRGCASAGLDESGTQQVLDNMAEQIGEPLAIMDLERLQPGLKHRSLILHDAEDMEIPFSESVELAQVWQGSTLEVVARLGHRRILRSPMVVQRVVTFLRATEINAGSCLHQNELHR